MQHSDRMPERSDAARVYQLYAPSVLAYLLRQVGSREDAEDILLEVFLAVLEKDGFVGDEQQLRAWIWAIARNKAADHFRRFSRYPSVPIAEVEEVIFEKEEQGPEQMLLRREEYRQLCRSLENLPAAQQEVLRLRFGHGLKCAEISQVVQKSESAVRMILSRALKLLRTMYSGEKTGRSL